MFFKTLCEFAGLQSLSCLNSLRNIANNTFKGFSLCAWGCAHTVQRFMCVHNVLSVFLQKLPILLFESWPHTGAWVSTIRLAVQWAPRICLSLPSQQLNSNFIPPSWDFYMGTGDQTQILVLLGKHLSIEPFPQPCILKYFQVLKTFGCLVACLFHSPTEYIQLSKLKIVRI